MKMLVCVAMMGMAMPVLGQATGQVPGTSAALIANPVVWSAHEIYARQSRLLVAAAEEMPEEKYGYRPTPEQLTFGRIIAHVAQSNGSLCALLSDTKAPTTLTVSETTPKAELVAALKASFDFCGPVIDGLSDAKLGDAINYHGAKVPRARALIELTDDLEDHYSQLAGYLRLNGMLPPSVAPAKR